MCIRDRGKTFLAGRHPGAKAGRAAVKAKLRVLFHGRCGGARGKKRCHCSYRRGLYRERHGTSGPVFPDVHRLDAGCIFVESASVHDFVAAAGASHHVDGRQTVKKHGRPVKKWGIFICLHKIVIAIRAGFVYNEI